MRFCAELMQAFINAVLPKEGFWYPALSACVCSFLAYQVFWNPSFSAEGNWSFCGGTLNVELI